MSVVYLFGIGVFPKRTTDGVLLRGGHGKTSSSATLRGGRHFLVVMDHAKTLDIRSLSERIGSGKLGFASERRLLQYLGLLPGSVSPFGLINDTDNHVSVYIDADLMKHDALNFHPNDNTATLTISTDDFKRYLEAIGNSVAIVEVWTRESALFSGNTVNTSVRGKDHLCFLC